MEAWTPFEGEVPELAQAYFVTLELSRFQAFVIMSTKY